MGNVFSVDVGSNFMFNTFFLFLSTYSPPPSFIHCSIRIHTSLLIELFESNTCLFQNWIQGYKFTLILGIIPNVSHLSCLITIHYVYMYTFHSFSCASISNTYLFNGFNKVTLVEDKQCFAKSNPWVRLYH